MSKTYPIYYSSSFPDEIDQFDRFTDLTLDTINYANQYSTYMLKGDFKNAAQLLIDHPELKPSLINAENLNRIIDAIKCIETFYVEDVQKYLIEIIKFKSTYSTSVKYSKYDLITYNDIAYLCISSTTPIGTLPTNKSYFIPLTWKGDKGNPGVNLTFLGSWSANSTYHKDSCVTYNNVLYASKIDDNISKTPSVNSEYWYVVFDINQFTTYDNGSSGLSSTNFQSAIDEVNLKVNTNTNKLNTIENGAQKNTITGIKGSAESSYRTGNVNITPANLGITVINNTSDANKSVKYSVSSGKAASCTGDSNSVNGFKFSKGTADLTPNISTLATNTVYFVYE